MWNKKPTRCHLVLYLFLLYMLLNMFHATYFPMDTQPSNRILLPTQPWHYTTCEKIPLSRQLLKYVAQLPNGHTTSQLDLTAYTATALHHMWKNTAKLSAPEDGHKVAWNMLSNL